MEEFLNNLIASGPSGIFAAAVVYLIIYLQRNSTKKTRDDDRDKLVTRITLIETEIENIRSLDLATKLAQIQTDLTWIKEKLK